MNNIRDYMKDGILYVEKQIEGGKIVAACGGNNMGYYRSVVLQLLLESIETKEAELKQQKKA